MRRNCEPPRRRTPRPGSRGGSPRGSRRRGARAVRPPRHHEQPTGEQALEAEAAVVERRRPPPRDHRGQRPHVDAGDREQTTSTARNRAMTARNSARAEERIDGRHRGKQAEGVDSDRHEEKELAPATRKVGPSARLWIAAVSARWASRTASVAAVGDVPREGGDEVGVPSAGPSVMSSIARGLLDPEREHRGHGEEQEHGEEGCHQHEEERPLGEELSTKVSPTRPPASG